MLILSFFRPFKITSLRNQFLTIRRVYSFQDEIKLKIKQNLNNATKLNECINYGLSAKTILKNDWIFNMDLSKWNS